MSEDFIPDKAYLKISGLWDKIIKCHLCSERMFFVYQPTDPDEEPKRRICYECEVQYNGE